MRECLAPWRLKRGRHRLVSVHARNLRNLVGCPVGDPAPEAVPDPGLGAYIVLLCGWIVLQKREPVATLTWVLSLALLPYLGYLIYFLLGPQKINRQRLRRLRSRTGLDRTRWSPVDDGCIGLALLGQATTGLPPSTATSAQLLIDGARTYDALIDAVAAAANHVHLEYYIYMPDQTGTRLRDALVERARAGVKGAPAAGRGGSSAVSAATSCSRCSTPAASSPGSTPTRFRPFTRTWVNLRTHRKIVVVDGRVAFTGGINITDEENERLHANAYRDLHLRLEGEVVRSVQVVFVEDWAYATGQKRRISKARSSGWPASRACRRHLLAGADLGAGLLLGSHPSPACRRHPRGQVTRLAGDSRTSCPARPRAWP